MWIRRLLGSFRRNKLEDQLNDELQFHIEIRAREFTAAGMSPEETHHKASADRTTVNRPGSTNILGTSRLGFRFS